MTKKILLGLFILLMIAVSIVGYNFYKNVKEPVSKTTFDAIPQNAALIIKENNFNAIYNKIASTNIIWEELVANTETGLKTKNQLQYLDSLLTGPFKQLITTQSILGSLHLSGANNFDFVFYISLPNQISENDIVQKIKNVTKKNVSDRAYDDVVIHTFPTDNENNVSLIIYKNTLAFSYSTILIEDVIRQLNSESNLLSDPIFSKIITTAGQSEDGNLFVNTRYFSKIINQYLNNDTKEYITNFENYTGWTELDLTVKPNTLSLNGFSFSNETDNHNINLLKDQKPQDINMLDILPYNTAFIYHYGLSNSTLFFENRKKLMKSKNQFFNYQKFLDSQTEKFNVDLEVEFLSNIGNELAFVITEPASENFENNTFIIFHTKELDQTKKLLANLAKKMNATPFEPIVFNDYQINKFDFKNVFSKLLGKPFSDLQNNYYTFIDDYVVFGNSENELKSFITDFSNKKVLSKNENFEAFNENLSSNSNIFIYNNIARSVNVYKAFCKEDYIPMIDEKLELFRKFEAIAFQVSTEKNNLFYNNIHLKYNPVYKQETASLWELALDTIVKSTPQLVINHNTNAKEIIVQDAANKIYLISNTGKVIWTKQLTDEVISEFHQVDMYKNNKLQLLFNTKSKIYLIDRNGDNVENYPIKLPQPASNGITVLDYEKNKNYRLLIGCNDNMVYNYAIDGKLVNGWEYASTESPANGKIWHFALSGKDYIVIPLQSGQIKIIERAGKNRLSLSNKIPVGKDVFLKIGNDLNKTYLTTIDTLGNVTKLFLNDKKEILSFEDVAARASFNFYDFNGNNSNDYIFTWENNMKIFDSDKKEIYSNEFQEPITKLPLCFKMADKTTKIGLITANQVYLINNKGIIEEGFPLVGSTPFAIADINNDNTLNLVVAHNNMIYTYNLK
jgi:hypothetical protein